MEQLLLAVTEGVSLHIVFNLSDALVGVPIVVTGALLARPEVTMGSLVHFRRFTFLFVTALRRVEYIFSVH